MSLFMTRFLLFTYSVIYAKWFIFVTRMTTSISGEEQKMETDGQTEKVGNNINVFLNIF